LWCHRWTVSALRGCVARGVGSDRIRGFLRGRCRADDGLVAVHTRLRVTELTSLRIGDVHLGAGAHLRCHGKGRKDRCTPLTSATATTLKTWLKEHDGTATDPLFPSRRGTPLSRDAVARLVTKHTHAAQATCPSLAGKNVTPHTLRHSTAMALLHAGVDVSVIALWLGHEGTETVHIYLHADMTIKERALARTDPRGGKLRRYTAPDTLLTFLKRLRPTGLCRAPWSRTLTHQHIHPIISITRCSA
jgi:integrase/recombinase XerD